MNSFLRNARIVGCLLVCLALVLPLEDHSVFGVVASGLTRTLGLAAYALLPWLLITQVLNIRFSLPVMLSLSLCWLSLVEAARPMPPPLVGGALALPFTFAFGRADLMAWALVLAIVGKALGTKSENPSESDSNRPGPDLQPSRTASAATGLNQGEKSPSDEQGVSEPEDDVAGVLGNLGYTRKEIQRAVSVARNANGSSFEELLRKSLQLLAK
jgi:hypothetical protein